MENFTAVLITWKSDSNVKVRLTAEFIESALDVDYCQDLQRASAYLRTAAAMLTEAAYNDQLTVTSTIPKEPGR